MNEAPTQLRALRDPGVFEIVWSDGQAYRLPFYFVRCECPCAVCIDEITGERLLDPATVARDIQPTQLGYSGNYALKIVWQDGHATGLYTWPKLYELCQQPSASVAAAPNL